jgi:hypothetical protein
MCPGVHLEGARLILSAQFNPAALLVVNHAAAAADACSGIGARCLQQDMASAEQGSSCTPMQEGAVCSTDGRHCRAGACSDEGVLPTSDAISSDLAGRCFEEIFIQPTLQCHNDYSGAHNRSSLFQLCCSCTHMVATAWHANGCGVLL